MPRIRPAFRYASLAFVFAGTLASCENPVGAEIERQSTPFVYYRGERIYLLVDPTRLTVQPEVAGDTNRVRTVLAQRSVRVDSIRPLWVENHWVVYLPGASARQAEEAARVLRLDGRVRFASTAYLEHANGCPEFLVNRLAVQFERGADESQIDRLNARTGVQNEESSRWGPHLYEYPPNTEYTPLEIAVFYHRQRIVDWAEPDGVNGCLHPGG